MQVEKIIATFSFVVSLMALQIVSVNGQTQQNNKVINKKGWVLQSIEDLEIKEENQIKIDGITVTEKKFQIGDSEPSVNLKKNLDCMFRSLSSYSINGKIFAFEGYCVPLSTVGNRKEYLGAMIRFLFFDEDGDGKFESRYSSLEMKIFVPDYLKQIK